MIARLIFRFILILLPISIAAGQVRLTTSKDLSTSLKERKQHTQVQLISSVKAIRVGSTFAVGILMRMDAGWHTYWKNGGEAGLPTQVKWKLPKGFTAGEIQWPLPHKYNETGEVLTYGYADENMLLVDITVPDELSIGSFATLHADVEWLECENICVPGNASVELKLPVSNIEPLPDNASLFEKFRSQVPASFSEQTEFTLESTTANARLEVRVKPKQGGSFVIANDALPDLYPDPIDELLFGRTRVEANASEATLQIPVSVYERKAQSFTFRGSLVYQMQGGERKAVTIEVPLSGEFCSSLPVSGETTSSGNVLDQTFLTVGSAGDSQPLHLFILFAFVGGLLLNVMPCVLPVIALKIFGLVQMAGDHPRQVKKLGWFFSLGILATFLAMALVVIILQAAGQQVGWGFQFQEPLFVIAMCVIVFGFGLSLFGVYEVGLPFVLAFAGMGSKLEKKEDGKGYASSFAEGVFATILATPCTAPFLGAALGFAFSQPALIILLIFTIVALGMALPYLVLTAKPAWMKFLPKPGEWMVNVKQFMGFLMMATMIWLLYVLGKQLGMEGVIWTSAFLLSIGISCWVLGKFATLTASRAKYVGTWTIAIVISVAGYWVFIESILNVRSVIAGVGSTTQGAIANEAHGIQWQPFSLDDLNTHLQGNETVFIDFTAEWCLTCKVNEKTVLADKEVIQKFKSTGIVPIKADWTNRNPDITRLLSKFGRSGVPLYVIFPAGKPNRPIVLPEVITSGIVLDAIDRVALLPS
jgi:thiol:disulfide interchange protein/DsbC/DsbD-like thiol-disulfide interchange protein